MVSAAVLSRDQPWLPDEREAWRSLVESRCGIFFAEARFHLLESRVRARMSALGLTDRQQYFQLAVSKPREWKALEPQLLNGDTAFFRHPDSFDALRDVVFPSLRGRVARAWCAGCSTGEEVYSIAALAQQCGGLEGLAVQGSDLNETALAKAREGLYAGPVDVRGFRRVRDLWQAGPALRSMTSFGVCNLLEPDGYPKELALIWSQNVLIYYRDWLRSRIVAGFERSLAIGGYLLLSPVDAMFAPMPPSLEPVSAKQVRLYRRVR